MWKHDHRVAKRPDNKDVGPYQRRHRQATTCRARERGPEANAARVYDILILKYTGVPTGNSGSEGQVADKCYRTEVYPHLDRGGKEKVAEY